MKKNSVDTDRNKDSLSYRFDTAMDYLQIAMQTFIMVPFILLGALFANKIGDIIEIADNNNCTIAEAAAIWSASQNL